ncbi:MAG: LysR family transcriptional regulator [Olsenella sp.]|nr:LysR family transcriptional regulator [Olsenella sp.]
MELRVLRYFLAVAREGNVTRAAAALHVTQPTLSRQLADLERELGCTLFVRGNRGATLTDDGMFLRKRAEEIVALADRTEREMLSPSTQLEGDIYFGAAETRAMDPVLRSFRRLHDANPRVSLHLHSGNADAVVEGVEKGLFDFGLTMGREVDSKFCSLPVPFTDTWGLIVRADDALASRESVTVEELEGMPLLFSSQEASSGEGELARSIDGLDLDRLNIVATYNLVYNASLMVEQGMGAAFSIDGLVTPAPGRFAFVPVEGLPPLRSTIVWKRFQMLPKAAQAFLDVLREDFAAASAPEG